MPDADFPSGSWTGYYQYPDGGRGHQDLWLHFEEGRITGTGTDEVGDFVVEGTYDASSKEAEWQKRFAGGHVVMYRGFRESVPGIWGTWNIPGNWSGGFHIWPVGEKAELTEELSTWQPQEETLPHVPAHAKKRQ